MTIPVLSPGHDLGLAIDYEELNVTTALRAPKLTGMVNARVVAVPVGSAPSAAATAIDPTLAVVCTNPGLGRRLASFSGALLTEALLEAFFGASLPSGYYDRDTFTRTDNAAAPGTTELLHQTPVIPVAPGGTWGVRTGALYVSAATSNGAFITWSTGRTRYDFSFKLAALPAAPVEFYAVVRQVPIDNGYLVEAVAGALVLSALQSGLITPLAAETYVPVVGDCIRIINDTEEIVVYVNEQELLRAAGLRLFQSATTVGLGLLPSASASVYAFDDMAIKTLPPLEPWIVFQAVGGGPYSVRCRYESPRIVVPR